MKLYLVQHGLSLSEEEDPQRSLSVEGREQTRKIAEFLKGKDIRLDYLWHSIKLRAQQTAKIISDYISCGKILERNDLNPLDPVSKFPQETLSLNKDLMIVGHLPFLAKLASLFLTGSEENQSLMFKNSGIVCLEYFDSWKIAWMVIPDLI